MTTLNTLFLPLLGGFLFFYISNWTAYFAANQPAQAVLFFSAFAGLCLLIVARLVTYYCEQVPVHSPEVLVQLGAAVIPPLLLTIVLAWAAAFLQSRLERTRIQGVKVVFAVVSTLLVASILDSIEAATEYLPRVWRTPYQVYWASGVTLFAAAAIPWSRVSSMPVSVILVRGAALMIAILLLTHWILPHLSDVLRIWGGVTQPIGSGTAVAGIGTAFFACVLGPLLALCFNVVYSKEGAAARLVQKGWATGLEQLIYLAARRERTIMLTLDDHKVYVGLVESVFTNPRAARDSYLKILPLISGYRDETTHRVHLTTYYRRVYRAIDKATSGQQVLSPGIRAQFQKILPIDRIVSAGPFDSRYYDSFQKQHRADPASDGVAKSSIAGVDDQAIGLRLRATIRFERSRFKKNEPTKATIEITSTPTDS